MPTNSDLLTRPKEMLTEIERQKVTIMRIHLTRMPCPNCRTPVNVYEAGNFTIDEDDFGHTQRSYRCPSCQRGLEYAVPFISIEPYIWQLVPEPPKAD